MAREMLQMVVGVGLAEPAGMVGGMAHPRLGAAGHAGHRAAFERLGPISRKARAGAYRGGCCAKKAQATPDAENVCD